MIAEISGKVNRQNTNLSELSEDELTGNFFGSLRYIPFDKGMKNILKNSIRPIELQSFIDEIHEEYWEQNLFLWKKVNVNGKSIELDVQMDFPSVIIGIEVKYYSGLSSEDEKNMEDISAENSNNQLSREARVLRAVGSDKKKLLLLLADDSACVKTIKNVKTVDGVQLGYVSWQEILVQLKKLTDLNDFEQLIVSDLIELLEKKGFFLFTDFRMAMQDISNTDYWNFVLPKQNYKFSFDFDMLIQEDYYEFG